MRFKPLLILILIALFVLPAHAQDNDCKPDLSGVTAALEQVQTATDSAAVLGLMTAAKNALDEQVAKCVNYAPETAGDKRSNPVAFGERRQIELSDDRKASIELITFDPAPNAVDIVGKDAEAGMRYIVAQYHFYCEANPDDTCIVDSLPFSAVGSENKEYKPRSNNLQSPGGDTLYGGGETTRYLVFLVEADETDFIIRYSPSATSVFFATS